MASVSMKRVIVLDAGPLGYVTSTKSYLINKECISWLHMLLVRGERIVIPEIAAYEVRRGWLRVQRSAEIAELDRLKTVLQYAPLTTAMMDRAAEFWAQARITGNATADDKALDADVILAAQATFLSHSSAHVVIATTNVKHLSLFVNAQLWRNIRP